MRIVPTGPRVGSRPLVSIARAASTHRYTRLILLHVMGALLQAGHGTLAENP